MTNREWNTAVGTGLLRLVVGFVLLRWRKPLAVQLAGADEGDELVPLLFGYFGIRDMTLGVLTLAATRPTGDVVKKVRLQGHADASDAVVVAAVTQSGLIPRERGVAAAGVAVVSALAEYATAARLKRG